MSLKRLYFFRARRICVRERQNCQWVETQNPNQRIDFCESGHVYAPLENAHISARRNRVKRLLRNPDSNPRGPKGTRKIGR